MVRKKKILKTIENEYDNTELSGSKAFSKVEKKVYPELPLGDNESIELFDFLVSKNEMRLFWPVTQWIKRKGLYELEFMDHYERWLYDHVETWWMCDIFCNRVLNPMVEKFPQLFENVMRWTDSSKTYVRRAAPVSLLQSSQSFKVNVSVDKVFTVVEKLKHDDEIHVQKGVGWLLKYAYLSYPGVVYDYLKNNVDDLPRVIFRYSLEKTPKDVKRELMSL